MSNKPLIKIVCKPKGAIGAKATPIIAIWPPDRTPYYGATLDREVAKIVMKDGTKISAGTHFVNAWIDGPVVPTSEPRERRDPPSQAQPSFAGGGFGDDDIPFAEREDW